MKEEQQITDEIIKEFRNKFEGVYYGKDIDNNPIFPPEQFKEDIEQFLLQALKKQRKEICEELEGLPKYDLSKTGIGKEFYIKRKEVIKIIKDK